MAHHQFTDSERSEISILKRKGYSNRSIGEALDCSHTSIGREIERNSANGIYDPRKAKQKDSSPSQIQQISGNEGS